MGEAAPHLPAQYILLLSSPTHAACELAPHRLTQRWEASLWLAGRQLYLGGFDGQEDAARAYDIAALACKGDGADTNFPASDYVEQMREVQGLTRVRSPPSKGPPARALHSQWRLCGPSSHRFPISQVACVAVLRSCLPWHARRELLS